MDEKENVQKTEKKGINKLLLIGGAVFLLIVLAGVFFIGYNMLAGGNNNDDKTTIGPVYQTEEYTVNLLDAGGRRFLRTQFSVEVDNKKVLSEINTKLPMFNHTVLRVLGNVTLADLEMPGSKDKIGAQLAGALNDILDDGEVTNIFFEVFVWQ